VQWIASVAVDLAVGEPSEADARDVGKLLSTSTAFPPLRDPAS
jgi:hypothetical protein